MPVSRDKFLEVKKQIETSRFASKNITSDRNSLIKYFLYRIKRPLLKWRYNTYQRSNPEKPWLTPDAIKALEILLEKDFSGLEYGSGRSTIFFSKLLGQLISVEHHKEWFSKVQTMLEDHGANNVRLHLVEPNQSFQNLSLSSEEQVFMTEKDYPIQNTIFQDYIDFLNTLSDESLDFALIDGRARTSCALKVIDKLKPGGLLVLDNSERRRYQQVHKSLNSWEPIFTTTGLTDTTIWRKP